MEKIMASKTCDICGKNTGDNKFLCYSCFKEAKKKKTIIQCNNCKEWHYTNIPCTCKNSETEIKKETKQLNETLTEKTNNDKEDSCIICGENADGWQYLCKKCNNDVFTYKQNYYKEENTSLTDHYYNLKNNIYRMTGFEEFIIPNCKKLIAMAKANDSFNHNKSLLVNVKQDVITIISKKKDKDITKIEDAVIEHNKNVTKCEHRTQDGHFVDSNIEIIIDDMLYTTNIIHALHYTVTEIIERTVVCDWYIPVLPDKGIYIELWGMNKKDYLDNEDEKIELYKKHKLKLISFYKEELLDTATVKRKLNCDIKNLKNEIMNGI